MNFRAQYRRLGSFVCLFYFFTSSSCFALTIPSIPIGHIYDSAGLLDSISKSELEVKLKTIEESTSYQFIVATFLSLEGEKLEDFSFRLAEKWKVGQNHYKGLILIIFKEDQVLRIEIGKGLEKTISENKVRSIIQNEIVPYFEQQDYKSGIFEGLDALLRVMQEKAKTK